jgi:hypothetical protein
MIHPIVLVVPYLAVGVLCLIASRQSIRRYGFGVVAVDVLPLLFLWPLCIALRVVIVLIEGNLWEHLE